MTVVGSVGLRRLPDADPAGLSMRTILLAPFTRRAATEFAYCLVALPVALSGFAVVVVLLAFGAGLTVSVVGAVLGLLSVVAAARVARGLGAVYRRLAGLLLGLRVSAPAPVRTGRGLLGRLDTRLRDTDGWRAVAYVVVKLPVALLGVCAAAWWGVGVFGVVAPLRTGRLGVAVIGLVMVWSAPWVVRGAVAVDRRLVAALLSPGRLTERVRELEETRALAVDDSAALLRRLERDLHDGAQVRLVALAMGLDMARERLGEADTEVRQLVTDAHRNAVETLAELRELARGLHPPALDAGLADALETLAARASLPVEVAVTMTRRPTAAIETIAYFCAAELLTNVIKHSGATRATLTVTQEGQDTLYLRVTDFGKGGATTGGGGLSGLAHRVRTVDGRLDLTSPPGGPTVVTIALPMHA